MHNLIDSDDHADVRAHLRRRIIDQIEATSPKYGANIIARALELGR